MEESVVSLRFPSARGLLLRNIQMLVDQGCPLLIECLRDAEYKHSTLVGLWRIYVEKDGEVLVTVAQRNHLPRDFMTLPGAFKFALDLGFKTVSAPLEIDEEVVRLHKPSPGMHPVKLPC